VASPVGNWLVERVGNEPAVLFHVPHAGTWIPADVRGDIVLDDQALDREVLAMTDWHTDVIARGAARTCGVGSVSFVNQVSRLVVDPERLPDDIEPMAAVGMGAVYLATSERGVLRRPDPGRDAKLRTTYFDPYAEALADLVDELLEETGSVTIIDVHSYPRVALPYERDRAAARPGVCIGTDADHTPAWLIESALSFFAGVEGGVALNTPFAGTYVPLRHFGRDERVRSIMVEIRRDTYMNESTTELHDGLAGVVERLSRFVANCVPTA